MVATFNSIGTIEGSSGQDSKQLKNTIDLKCQYYARKNITIYLSGLFLLLQPTCDVDLACLILLASLKYTMVL